MTHLKYSHGLLIPLLFAICTTSYGQATSSPATDHKHAFWARRITPNGKLIIEKYGASITAEQDISDLEIWDKLDKEAPISFIYWDSEPDWKSLLLSKGHARLKDESRGAPHHLEAQNNAKQSQLGLWAQVDNESVPTFERVKSILWYLLYGVFFLVSLWGGAATYRAIQDWRKRHQVPLILLGRPSTGKSWLWHRLVDPDVSVAELEGIKRSTLAQKRVLPQSKPLGRYEVRQVPIDTPGGRSGEQVNVLLEEKSLFRRLVRLVVRAKSVWLITLSTTPEKNVGRSSSDEAKIDNYYIEQQLGHLDLPVGILSSKKTPKPKMVIACITKYDLFSDHDPRDTESDEVTKNLQSIFMRHTSRVQKECSDQGVPFKVIMCSAREGWGTNEIWRQIEGALFR